MMAMLDLVDDGGELDGHLGRIGSAQLQFCRQIVHHLLTFPISASKPPCCGHSRTAAPAGDPRDVRRNLLEHLHPFAGYRGLHALAARTETTPPTATKIATCRRTKSAARAGRRP